MNIFLIRGFSAARIRIAKNEGDNSWNCLNCSQLQLEASFPCIWCFSRQTWIFTGYKSQVRGMHRSAAVDLLTHWLLLTWILNENNCVPRSSFHPTNGQTSALSPGHLFSIACEIEKLESCLWNGRRAPRAMLQLPRSIATWWFALQVTQLISIERIAPANLQRKHESGQTAHNAKFTRKIATRFQIALQIIQFAPLIKLRKRWDCKWIR